MKRLSDVLPPSQSPPTDPINAGGRSFDLESYEAQMRELSDPPKCPKCDDFGFVSPGYPLGHPNFGQVVPCGCRETMTQDFYRERIALSRLPVGTAETHRFSTWKHLRHLAAIVSEVQRFTAGDYPHPFLTLVGRTGTGKTHLALAAAWDWLESNRGTVAYYQVEAFLDTLRRGFDRDNVSLTDETYHVLMFAATASLLVLDDLGAQKETEFANAKLDELIDSRYINRRPLIVTTNLGMGSLAPRIADRLAEGRVHILKTGSYRQRAKGETA